nr:YegP family protein [Nocardia rhizosphaerihabitans]
MRHSEHSRGGDVDLPAAGKFRRRLKVGNGEIIAQSQAYESKEAAKKGISSVQNSAPGATIVDT